MPAGGASGQIATASSPALECPSHICLLPGADRDRARPRRRGHGLRHRPALHRQLRVHEDCEDGERGNADDPADKRCRGGFACTWPMTVGTFACQKLCVCTDFVNVPAGGFTKPAACE